MKTFLTNPANQRNFERFTDNNVNGIESPQYAWRSPRRSALLQAAFLWSGATESRKACRGALRTVFQSVVARPPWLKAWGLGLETNARNPTK